MKFVLALCLLVAVVNGQDKYDMSRTNSQKPEWHIPKEEREGLQSNGMDLSEEVRDHINKSMLGGSDHVTNLDGGTDDIKDRYQYGEAGFGRSEDGFEKINMTPYVIQTKDERWQAGVPNYEAPEEGYLIQTFDVEGDARAWVIDKTGADNSINYPLAPDVDPEFNLANQNDPEDKNANVMQDGAPKRPKKVELGHMEPAYVGEYDEKAIFGDHIKGDHHEAHGEDHGELQDAIYFERTSDVRSSLRDMRTRAVANGERVY